MITRLAKDTIHRLSKQFPAVLILGPRQCGKTTLVKECIAGSYFDLEKPSDYQVFEEDPELVLRRINAPIILDEAQTLPSIFPVLRALIDEERHTNGRFFLLGSVNPDLIRQLSESLAGRVGIIELTPFVYPEVRSQIDINTHWLKGGFPDACRETHPIQWMQWQEDYIRTYVERDIQRQGLKSTPIEIRRFMTMLTHIHGGLLNASELGRALGINYHTVQHYLSITEAHFLIRQLPPYYANIGKRLVKAPKIYIRDSGMLHYLLNISEEHDLLTSPKRGFSWEGYVIEQIITLEKLKRPGAQFFFYRTQAGAEVDLIVQRGSECVGYEFKSAVAVRKNDASGLKACLDDGIISSGMIVYLGNRNFPLYENIDVICADELISN